MRPNDRQCGLCPGCPTCSLDCLQIGCRARVMRIGGDREFRRRLLEMGFCNDACIEVVGRAPFGDPIEFNLRGYRLCLRHEQAKNVLVELQPEQRP